MMARVAIVFIVFSMAAFQTLSARKFPRIAVDDFNVQATDKTEQETDGTDQMDMEFGLVLGSKVGRPKKPNVDEVGELFETQREQFEGQFEDNITVTGDFKFHDLQSWVSDILKYCPRKDKYQCTTTDFQMSCFYHYHKDYANYYQNMGVLGHWEWCCPFYPEIIIKKCACCQCAVLTSQYALVGQCRRRYTWRSFLAVCYNDGAWANIRYIHMELPSSCYCRIDKL